MIGSHPAMTEVEPKIQLDSILDEGEAPSRVNFECLLTTFE